jgi:hypothetical protein
VDVPGATLRCVPAQGWYPDPSGRHGSFRWYDGRSWTHHTTTDPGGPVPAPGPRRRRGALVAVLVGGLVLVLAVAGVAVQVSRSGAGGPRPAPSTSAWDEQTTPSPPLPSASGDPDPSDDPGAQVPCEPAAGGEPPPEQPGRVSGGPLSFPVIDGWQAPTDSTRFPHGRSARVTALRMVEEDLPWQSSAEVGELVLGSIPAVEQAPAALLECVLTSSFYASVDVRVAESRTTAVRVDGHPGVQLDARITFDHPRLRTQGSVLRFVVVDAAVDGYWFSAVPQERADLVAAVEEASAGLRVER